jgi:hypothetical protein
MKDATIQIIIVMNEEEKEGDYLKRRYYIRNIKTKKELEITFEQLKELSTHIGTFK